MPAALPRKDWLPAGDVTGWDQTQGETCRAAPRVSTEVLLVAGPPTALKDRLPACDVTAWRDLISRIAGTRRSGRCERHAERHVVFLINLN